MNYSLYKRECIPGVCSGSPLDFEEVGLLPFNLFHRDDGLFCGCLTFTILAEFRDLPCEMLD